MAAFNIFKKKKDDVKEEKIAPEKKVQAKRPEVKEEPLESSAAKEKEQTQTKRAGKIASAVILRTLEGPHVTEKASMLAESNKYIFRVYPKATKGQIKEAVEHRYGVDVRAVRVVTVPSKKVRVGRRREGIKKGYKKAMVQIREGQKIEILPT